VQGSVWRAHLEVTSFVEYATIYTDRIKLNFVNKTNLVHKFILSIFINLYMFRPTMCPSSGETTVFLRHLVLVILCGWLSGMQGEMHSILHTSQSSTQNKKYQVSQKKTQLFLLMMGISSAETCRDW